MMLGFSAKVPCNLHVKFVNTFICFKRGQCLKMLKRVTK